MKSFFAGIVFTFATLALVGSGFSVYQVSKLQSSVETQADQINELSQKNLADLDIPATQAASSTADNIPQNQVIESTPPQTQATPKKNVAIKPGQFVNVGFENKLKVEIESAKRIQNPETGDQDIVVVNFRILRLFPEIDRTHFFWREVRGRNPNTSEEYDLEKSSDWTNLRKLPNNAWANAYVWLKVPQGIETIDISVPETAMFRNIPIGS